MPRSSAKHSPTSITWEIGVPLLTNSLVLGPTIKGFLLAGTSMWALLAFLFAVQGKWDLIGTMAIFCFVLTGVVTIVGLLGTALVFGNRMRFRFTVDAKGATSDRIDRRAAVTDGSAMLFGLLARKPGVAGAGMLSASQATTRVAWSSVARVRPHPWMHAIGLHNVWRATAVLYCPPDRFDEILAAVRKRAEEAIPSRRRNPLPGLLYAGEARRGGRRLRSPDPCGDVRRDARRNPADPKRGRSALVRRWGERRIGNGTGVRLSMTDIAAAILDGHRPVDLSAERISVTPGLARGRSEP